MHARKYEVDVRTVFDKEKNRHTASRNFCHKTSKISKAEVHKKDEVSAIEVFIGG